MKFLKIKRQIQSSPAKIIGFLILFLGLSFSIRAQTEASVEKLVNSLSAGKLRVESKATPYKLTGDFNGDKIEDIAIIVELMDSPENVSSKIKKVYPYYSKEVAKNDLMMLIVHGAGKGWKTAQKESFLLIGENSALIFEKQRLAEKGDGVKIEKDKGGKLRLYFPTEGSEGYLKWNGKKYVWWESEP